MLKYFFFCLLSLLIFFPQQTIFAEESDLKYITQRHQEAVDKALVWLAKQQDPKKGSWGGGGSLREKNKFAIATTSFAVLAFLGRGHLPGRGPYGDNVSKGISYILKIVGTTGYISKIDDASRMHGHAYATMMLAEVFGAAPEDILIKDPKFEGKTEITNQFLKEKLQLAIQLVIASQTTSGGWGYEPPDLSQLDVDDHEGSITVCQLQALRSARNAGFWIDSTVINRALSYLRKSAKKNGSFKYRLNDSTSKDSYGLTAAAISTFHAIGEYDSPEVRNGFDFLKGKKYDRVLGYMQEDEYYHTFWCYAQYYATQAFFHHPSETMWEQWYYKSGGIQQYLLAEQNPNGSWKEPQSFLRFGENYSTAVCALILEVPYNYLPIFQR